MSTADGTRDLASVRVVVEYPPGLPAGRLRVVDGDDVLIDTVRDARGLAWSLLNSFEGRPGDAEVGYVIAGRQYAGTVRDVVLLGAAITEATGELDPNSTVSGRLEVEDR